MDPLAPKRRRRTYTIEDKLVALDRLAAGESRSSVAADLDVPESSLRDWRRAEADLRSFSGSKKRKSMGGAGRPESIPFSAALKEHTTSLRHMKEALSSYHMMEFMKMNHQSWLTEYLAAKSNDVAAYNSLLRLCQRFANRHGFSVRTPCYTKEPTLQLLEARKEFSVEFWRGYGTYQLHEILNVDETSVYYDTPPNRIWAVKGGSAKIKKSQKHSARLTAVLTIRADRKKIPLFFIVQGKPGGWIEQYELPTYPICHFYAVQENGRMDSTVWEKYVTVCLAPEVEGPSVLLVDNFDAHVSDEGQTVVVEKACCAVCPLPANATSVCQPLDVGTMGPLKSRLRAKWLREPRTAKTAKEKRIAMIKRSISAYEDLTSDTVSGSFTTAIPKPAEI